MKHVINTVAIAALLSGTAQTMAQDPNAVAAVAPTPAPRWETTASAGFTITRGNSESVLANLGLKTERKWEQNELKLGADGLYGKTKNNGVETKSSESVSAFGQYNRLFAEKWYGYLRVEGLHDDVADVNYRLTVSPGVGYYFIKKPQTQLDAEVGPGFVYEETGITTNRTTDSYMTVRVAENFTHSLNDHVRIWQKAEFLPQVDDFENYIFNFGAGIEADLTKSLSFGSKVLDTYDNRPAPGRKCNDLIWVNNISYKF
jgi:putative salt-induced outer membrane protein YdiY